MHILVLNAGSSSYKLALYSIKKPSFDTPLKPIWSCDLDSIGHKAKSTIKKLLDEMVSGVALDSLESIDVVGHRVVHGGSEFVKPVIITPKVKESIKSLFPLAPLHNPANLAGIEIIESLMPKTPQVAVFDTAFHSTLSEAANTYPGPYKWKELGIKRYGFHGINHHYCMLRCAKMLKKDVHDLRIITCHLGNGSSLAAIQNGKCIDTTMGFTPLDGMMMGTRPGALDPGIAIYLEQKKRQSAEALFHELNFDSGLKGISGITSDMREILKEKRKRNARATLAYDMYVHSLRRNIGAMAGVLEEVNVLIFTAGIGENAHDVRREGCRALNLKINEEKNRMVDGDAILSLKKSKVAVLVIKAEEDWCIACECMKLIH